MTLGTEWIRKWCHYWLGKNVIHWMIQKMKIRQHEYRYLLIINVTSWLSLIIRFIRVYRWFLNISSLFRTVLLREWVAEVTFNLLDIYTTFEALAILHSDSGREFVNRILDKVHAMWENVKIVRGKLGDPRPKVHLKKPIQT